MVELDKASLVKAYNDEEERGEPISYRYFSEQEYSET